MEYFFHTLDNGIRLIHHNIKGPVAHCGMLVNAGSRDENDDEHGIAHFIEHMLFKGTTRRKAYHILSRLEDVGGELNAYTTKEETAIHASFLKENYERTIELISDILFNSSFPTKEIEKEKDVVIEEINSYLDSPSELIFDDFEELIFSNQPIGRNILGSPASVKKISRKKIKNFMDREYMTGEMVFCSVGEIPEKKILKFFQKYFSFGGSATSHKKSHGEWIYKPVSVTRKKDTFQNHCIIGNAAYDLKHKKRVAMFLLNNILGGQGMNSRLNLSLREKNGLAYNVESNYNPYCDTGIFSIYFGTDSKLLEKSTEICMSELKRLRSVKLGPVQMSKARNQMKGYLARGYDNHENLMLSMAKSMMVFDRIETFESSCSQIDAITSEILLDIANEVFEPSRLSTLIYK